MSDFKQVKSYSCTPITLCLSVYILVPWFSGSKDIGYKFCEEQNRGMRRALRQKKQTRNIKYLKSCKQKCHCAFFWVCAHSVVDVVEIQCAINRKSKLQHYSNINYENYNNNIINKIQTYHENCSCPNIITSSAFHFNKRTQELNESELWTSHSTAACKNNISIK